MPQVVSGPWSFGYLSRIHGRRKKFKNLATIFTSQSSNREADISPSRSYPHEATAMHGSQWLQLQRASGSEKVLSTEAK